MTLPKLSLFEKTGSERVFNLNFWQVQIHKKVPSCSVFCDIAKMLSLECVCVNGFSYFGKFCHCLDQFLSGFRMKIFLTVRKNDRDIFIVRIIMIYYIKLNCSKRSLRVYKYNKSARSQFYFILIYVCRHTQMALFLHFVFQ